MKKILLSSILLGSILFASSVKTGIPLSANVLSVENSGDKTAIEAYQDGIGIYTVQQVGGTPIDNSEMNELVYKYGVEAKAAEVEMKAYVNTYGSASEKIKALSVGKFEPMTPTVIADGTVCNDGNDSTTNDKYSDGVCVGESIYKQSCKELYASGVTTSGNYFIDLDGDDSKYQKTVAYCDMDTVIDGVKGWTLLYSFSNGLNTNLDGYLGSNIDTKEELTAAGITYYIEVINSTGYDYVRRNDMISFYYSGGTIGFISFKAPVNSSKVNIEWGNYYAFTNSIYKNNSLIATIGNSSSLIKTQINVVEGDTIKITEAGIVNVGKIWIY